MSTIVVVDLDDIVGIIVVLDIVVVIVIVSFVDCCSSLF